MFVILLGPGEREFVRFNDLMASLLYFEKDAVAAGTLLVVNDRNEFFDREKLSSRLNFRKMIVMDNPYIGVRDGNLPYDRCTAGMLAIMKVLIDDDEKFSYILKLDTDAVVCGKFADKITSYFQLLPKAGMIGSLYNNPDGTARDAEVWWGKWIRGTCGLLPRHWLKLYLKNGAPYRPLTALNRWRARNRMYRLARREGWSVGSSILGGAYAVSPAVVHKLRTRAYLVDDLYQFDCARIGEDVAVSLLVAALGLSLEEYNKEREVFAIWYQKPTMPLADIVRKEYGIVHSIKSDDPDEEREMRQELARLSGMPMEFRSRMGAFL